MITGPLYTVTPGGDPTDPRTGGGGRGEPRLAVTSLSKSFAGNRALSGFDLEIGPGEIHVLMGQNGSGKSTFIKVLSGYHLPDPGGEVRIDGHILRPGSPETAHRLGCRFVHQDLGLISHASVLDNLSYGFGYPTTWGTIRTRQARARAGQALELVGLEVDPGTLLGRLSAVERTQVAVARALRTDGPYSARVLVLDEPTASLPVDEVDHLLSTVRAVARQGVAVLYVTHHIEEVFQIGARVTVLRDGRRVGSYERDRLTRSDLIRDLVGEDVERPRRTSTRPDPGDAAVLEVDGLSAGALTDIRLSVHPGEIIGFAGLAGSGRETVLSAVFGSIERRTGAVRVHGQEVPPGRPDLAITAGMAYMPADRKTHGGVMSLSARENMTLASHHPFATRLRIRRKDERAEASSWFSRLGVRPANGIDSVLGSFSGGNQQKVLFAKWIRLTRPVFLLDDPTQGVDIGAKSELHRQLIACADAGTAVLVSSSDLEELTDLCDRVIVFQRGRIVTELHRDSVNPTALTHLISTTEGSLVP